MSMANPIANNASATNTNTDTTPPMATSADETDYEQTFASSDHDSIGGNDEYNWTTATFTLADADEINKSYRDDDHMAIPIPLVPTQDNQ